MPADAAARDGWLARVRATLPRGGSLPPEEWTRRHAGIMALLWLNVLTVPVYSLLVGRSAVHSIDSGVALGVMATLAASPRLARPQRMALASLALLTAAAMLIHASGGRIEAHFYFFVLIIVLTMYEDWMPFLLAVGFVLVHHGVIGTLQPREVFDRREEWEHPLLWAGIHATFVAAAGIAAVAAWRLNENVRASMRAAHDQLEIASETDSLTKLGNRRKLMADLQRLTAAREQAVLVILDLDGFKSYNDTFGHPAGDALLARIGARLYATFDGRGHGYRLGGDEFCAVWRVDDGERANVEATSAAAMCERGEGFSITAAYGAVSLPAEADSPEAALQAADKRMYTRKHGSGHSASGQSRDVLLQTLIELRPELAPHLDAVMVLAGAVAQRLGLPAHLSEQICQAAQLHDIGKIAIPAALLNKPGPLDDEEWAFMRRYTAIGERLIAAAPALGPVAALVRSSHERFDGRGYPDGLAGEQIPLGSRIVFVCDAFDAMTSDRPWRLALAPAAALAELQRCAGTQFDPAIVAALLRAVEDPADGSAHADRTDDPRRLTSADGEPPLLIR
jgi:diguanylate cyclase (GGDEF)-like protein